MSAETRVRVRLRPGGAWEVRGMTPPLPHGVGWTWAPMPPWEPWPALLEVARATEGFDRRAAEWFGVVLVLRQKDPIP